MRPVCFAILAAFSVLVAPWQSAAQDIFTVSGLKVDVTAANAAEARAQALAQGERRALDILLRRLTLRADHARLPKLGGDKVAGLVQDLSVANEKTSAVRYLAELTFRFKADDIRGLLRSRGFNFAETRSKPVLLIPVYQAAGAVSLWDDPNPWREAWSRRAEDGGDLVPIVLPNGDLTDIATIGAEQAMNGDQQRLDAMTQRYDTADVMVALGVLGTGPRGRPSLRVTVSRYGDNVSEQAIAVGSIAGDGEGVNDLIDRAVGEVADRIEDQWKRDNLLEFERTAILAAVLPISGLRDWVEAKHRLARVAVIEHTDLVLLTREEVRLNLRFLGDVEQLALALAQADLALSERDGTWVIRLKRDASSGPRVDSGDKN